nr:phage tail tape measure protein [Methylobacterium sp. Leaf122]
MIVEELVGRLGFKVGGQGDAQKFIRLLDEARKGLKRLQSESRSTKFDVRANVSGLTRVTRELDKGTAAARRFRLEAERASRTRIAPRVGPSGRLPTDRPGRRPHGSKASAEVGGNPLIDTVTTVAGAVTGYKAVKKFADLETAANEMAKTAEKNKEDVLRDTESFRVEGPKIGMSQKALIEGANAFVAAGIDYDTSLKSSMKTARAARAATVDFDDAAAAGVVMLQNLKINVQDLGKAYDIAIKGGKLGKAEFKELASSFPELAASAGKSGIVGPKGLRDVIAATEVVRESTSTTGEATTNLKDLLEKIIAPDVAKHFKKHAGINLEKELLKREKKGTSRLDAFLDILSKHTKGGNEFRVSEYLHEQQSRSAAVALLRGRDKYESHKREIDTTAEGTVETDLGKTLNTTQGSFDRFTSSVDRAATDVGEFGSGTARALSDIASAALQWKVDGKGVTPQQSDKVVDKMNRLFGAPPTYHNLLGNYGLGSDTTAEQFADRFRGGSARPRMIIPTPKGMQAPTFGGLGDRMDWMRQSTQQAVSNVTNNTNTGNDQRTQSAHVTVNATGLEAVGATVLAKVQAGLSSLGPSIAKTNLTPTGSMTAP